MDKIGQATVATIVPLSRFRRVFMQEVIGSDAGKLQNKSRGVTRNTWSPFPVLVNNSFACKIFKSVFGGGTLRDDHL